MPKVFFVTFECPLGRNESVLREGETPEEINKPDDLNCPVKEIRLAEEVIITAEWYKNGEYRCNWRKREKEN